MGGGQRSGRTSCCAYAKFDLVAKPTAGFRAENSSMGRSELQPKPVALRRFPCLECRPCRSCWCHKPGIDRRVPIRHADIVRDHVITSKDAPAGCVEIAPWPKTYPNSFDPQRDMTTGTTPDPTAWRGPPDRDDLSDPV